MKPKVTTLLLAVGLAALATAQRPLPSGTAFSQPLAPVYGTNFTDMYAMPPTPEEAKKRVAYIQRMNYNGLRLHHWDWVAEKEGTARKLKYTLDACYQANPKVFVILSGFTKAWHNPQYFKERVVNPAWGGSAVDLVPRNTLRDRFTKLFAEIGDHPAILAFEPLNEEPDDPNYAEYQTWATTTCRSAGYTGPFLWQNHGSDNGAVLASSEIIPRHVYFDSARTGDSNAEEWNTCFWRQPWHFNALKRVEGKPHVIGECGDITRSHLRAANEIFIACEGRRQGVAIMDMYAWGGNEGHTSLSWQAMDRFATATDPLKRAAQQIASRIFRDTSPLLERSLNGDAYVYRTAYSLFRMDGDPYGASWRIQAVVSEDGLPIATSKKLLVFGGGEALMTGYKTEPDREGTAEPGIFRRIVSQGTLPAIIIPGGMVQVASNHPQLTVYDVNLMTMDNLPTQGLARRMNTGQHVVQLKGLLARVVAP